MEKYESKQHQILRPVSLIYPLISDFTLLTPAVASRVEGWQATPDKCSFKVKGIKVGLMIVEKVEGKHVKIQGDPEVGGLPIDFSFWIQLHSVSENDTRMRLVLHAELNMMMRMMVGSKLQEGLDKAAEGFAVAFNSYR